MYELIEHLKKKQWLWQGISELQSSWGFYPTGLKLLDERLKGGFPHHGVVELKKLWYRRASIIISSFKE